MIEKYKNLSVRDQNIIKSIGAIIFLILIFSISIIVNYIEAKKEEEESKQVVLVDDYSRYVTVINCVNRYLSIVKSGDTDNILLLINEEYKDIYNITASNVNQYIPVLSSSSQYTYVGKEMYKKQISKSVTEYYVYGSIGTDTIDGITNLTPYNLTVILYEDDMIFSVKAGVNYEE